MRAAVLAGQRIGVEVGEARLAAGQRARAGHAGLQGPRAEAAVAAGAAVVGVVQLVEAADEGGEVRAGGGIGDQDASRGTIG